MRSQMLALTLLFSFSLILSICAQAKTTDSPVLMSTVEIQNLPVKDRSQYLRSVKEILAKSPYNLLLEDSSTCEGSMKSCAPALYGAGLCVPKRTVTPDKDCEMFARKSAGYEKQAWLTLPDADEVWSNYRSKLSDVCSRKESNIACQKLRDKRIEIFMNRRTH